jgi:hypothetical protein
MIEILNLLSNSIPAILGLSQSVLTFYKNEKNTITFITNFIKFNVLFIICIYLTYLYFYEGKISITNNLLFTLVQNIITLISILITIYLLYKENKKLKKL